MFVKFTFAVAKFVDAAAFVKLTVGAVLDSTENFDLLGVLTTHSDQVYTHSLAVAMYAVLISKEIGIKSEVPLNKIGMAGLMHDIEKKEVDAELLGKPRHLLTLEERKESESHVIRGQGYPLKKVKRDQHSLSRILQCANIFIEAVNTNRLNKKPVDAPEILSKIER